MKEYLTKKNILATVIILIAISLYRIDLHDFISSSFLVERANAQTSATGNWDGWIRLRGSYLNSVRVDRQGEFHGFAWGGDPLGWISFNGEGSGYKVYTTANIFPEPPTLDLRASSVSVKMGENARINWDLNSPRGPVSGTPCTASGGPGTTWAGQKSSNGTFIFPLAVTTSFSMICNTGSNGSTNLETETVYICGNGIKEAVAGEQCDDGNNTNGDGCSSICKNEANGNGGSSRSIRSVEYRQI